MGELVQSVDDVAELVDGAQSVALGGFILYKKPMAIVRALIRRGFRDIHLICPVSSIEADMLLSSGGVSTFTFAFCNLDIIGAAPHFRAAAESGAVEMNERGTHSLMRGLEAGERDLPGLPARTLFGSDLQAHLTDRSVELLGERVMIAAAVRPDVAFVHAQYADPVGNVKLDAEGFDFQLVKAAGRVGVTVEQLVPEREFDRLPGVVLESEDLDRIAVAPFGAHPTSCFPFYSHDVRRLLSYADDAAARADTGYGGDVSEDAYLDQVGAARLAALMRTMSVGRSYLA